MGFVVLNTLISQNFLNIIVKISNRKIFREINSENKFVHCHTVLAITPKSPENKDL